MKRCWIVAVLLFMVGVSAAQPLDSLWSATYGNKPWDELNKLILTSDGGYLLVGQIGSYGGGRMSGYVVKTDSVGREQWSRIHIGDGSNGFYSAVQTDDGGYMLMGYCWTYRTKSLDFQLMKTDSTGKPVWSQTYGDYGAEQCFAGIRTADGGYILAGYTASFGIENDDYYLVKTDARGYKQWSWSYGGTGGERCYAVIQADDGGYLLAGYTDSFGWGGREAYVVKTDSDGDQQWYTLFGGRHNDEARDVIQLTDGTYAVSGSIWHTDIRRNDFYLAKIGTDGQLFWSRSYGGDQDEGSYTLMQTVDGGFLLTGYVEYYDIRGKDFYLMRFDPDGEQLWSQSFGALGADWCRSFAQMPDGGFILGGGITHIGAMGLDFGLIRIGLKPPDEGEMDE